MMKNSEFSRKLSWIIYGLLLSIVTACNSGGETPSQVKSVNSPEASPLPSWKVYTNETWEFSFEHPTAWVVSANGTDSGFIGKQVFWWVSNEDPMQQHGDDPAVDQITETEINGQPVTRILGYYQGAIGDMGFQQYLRYVIQKGDVFYMFTLYAVDALGIPSSMMAEKQPLRENDIAVFEQMITSVKFKE